MRGVNADRERLSKHHHLFIGILWKRHALAARHHFVPGKSAIDVRDIHCTAKKAHGGTLVLLLALTIFAFTAGFSRIDSHFLLRLQAGIVAFNDVTNHFMPEYHGHLQRKAAHFSLLVVVQIGAADSAARNAHQRAGAIPLHLLLCDTDLLFAGNNAGLRFNIHVYPVSLIM